MSFTPPPGAVAKVSMIDTGSRMCRFPVKYLLQPPIQGFDEFPPLASWAFLIENPTTGKKVLFDLGMPASPETCPPLIKAQLDEVGVELRATKTVGDVLTQHGVDLGSINSAIWSHFHWDHTGNVCEFPGTTELVIGPGCMDAFYPGYPKYPDAHVQESYFKDRPVREITFDDGVPIGSFRAHDFFGDGSFYLLDAPGHITGHMAGLARTSHGHGDEPDTFILMGADTVHHGSELRPSDELPIPKDKQRKTHGGGVCCFHQLNVDRGRRASGTFFDAVLMEDPEATAQTIRHSQVADALENVFVIAAHDMAVEGVVDLFPATANDWKARGWKEASLWGFLSDLEVGFSKA